MNKDAIRALLKANGMTDAQIDAVINAAKAEKNTYRVVEVVRLYFGSKPNRDTIAKLGEAGFHWNRFEKYWYADATDKALEFISENKFEEAK